MPLNDERPSVSVSDDQGSDTESSERCDSMASSNDFESSRQSFTSDSSSKVGSPASSPPKVVAFDEIMACSKNLCNLRLAHEIVVNGDFQVEQPELPQNSLERKVKEIVHKAFWDKLEKDLMEDPPEYEHAIRLVEEIKEILLSFLNPGANRIRSQICEVLDIDLLRQQAANDAVDICGIANYIITVMEKLCAPIRDSDVKKLREISDIVLLFKEIFHVLELMKTDMVNFTIWSVRPHLQQHSIEFERETFQAILDKTPSALDHATEWIKESIDELMVSKPCVSQCGSLVENSKTSLPSPIAVLNRGYVKLLDWDHGKKAIPETLMADEARLKDLQYRLDLLKTMAAILLIIYNVGGGPISGIPKLADRLKRVIRILLEGMNSQTFNLKDALENISAQVCSELNKSLTERGYSALSSEVQASLAGQIGTIRNDDNPVFNLIDDRVHAYLTNFLSYPLDSRNRLDVPGGLLLIQAELETLGAQFLGIVNFNKQVYSPFYVKILRKLLFLESPEETANPAPTTVKSE
ncbi:T-complex protein 11-like protein 2 isoform X1 [Erpetoichthys calabaricus]|uniref:T-complex 11, testis-specific-like 2 n=1 Tax=Erpetoichthys calabaricus TaxID=27687 RepID=A0A8C4X6C2_ERPCA|nr:T-complex protein 11-like protein 2 isoform X1 [Erpetoichthys calabaricus]XP_028672567.1 T-complex protein 11-like protein 2 isoform X1 [Erpetoichthys calabaricus]